VDHEDDGRQDDQSYQGGGKPKLAESDQLDDEDDVEGLVEQHQHEANHCQVAAESGFLCCIDGRQDWK